MVHIIMRFAFVMICFLGIFSLGCAEKQAAPVSTGLDQKAIDDYQAQADGDGYENYQEPK